jgi:hypothetical protein
MEQALGTTNLLLGLMAAVAVIEGLVLIGAAVAGFIAYRRVMQLIEGLEERHVVPAMTRVNALLDDVKGMTSKVKEETARVDHAIHTTMDRVDDTVDRVRTNVRQRTSWIVGAARGARVIVDELLNGRSRSGTTGRAM